MIAFVKKFIPPSLVSMYHFLWAWGSAARYGFPSRKLVVIGVTGTNGKSSVVWLLARMLEEGGFRVAASSSIEFQIGEKRWPNTFKMTMPGRGRPQKFLRNAVQSGCTHAVLEVTSEGVRQHRHRFIDFAVAVFLNLSPEHIERHGSFEAYRREKEKIFRRARIIIANLGDRSARHFLRYPAERRIGFRLLGQHAVDGLPEGGEEYVADHVEFHRNGVRFTVRDVPFTSSLLGAPNLENVLAATATAAVLGVTLETCVKASAKTTSIPGRLEIIVNDRGLHVYVDYAHTPAALESAYRTVRTAAQTDHRPMAHLTCVLGAAGGGRDRWKRAELGAIAARFCDRIFVTDEDPYDENPDAIRSAVLKGIRQRGGDSRVEEIVDRRLAVRRALLMAPEGGIVIITGKGCEPWMMLAHGKRLPWDDRAIVREEVVAIRRDALIGKAV